MKTPMTIKARIFRSSKRHFDCQRSDNKEMVTATALATLLKGDGHIVVGDWVELIPPPMTGQEWVIEKVIERSNSIFRNLPRIQKKSVIASNVDVLLVVTSAGSPAYKRGLIDRYLVRSEYWDIPAYLIFNKMDLYDKEEFDIAFEAERLKWLNVECFELSAANGKYSPQFLEQGFQTLLEKLTGKTAILVGQSGVGKSRLITELSEGRITLLSAETNRANKGSHTTTWAELIDGERFALIDSPGIRSMSLSDLTKEELIQSFSDVQEFATKCKFVSCNHGENNKGCFFQTLNPEEKESQLILSRLDSYKRVLEEVADIPDWQKKP
jgi:ribosome biogenesis GTPase